MVITEADRRDTRYALDGGAAGHHPDQEASIDEALPGDAPTDRYEEACRRLDETLRTAVARGKDSSIVYAGLYGVLQSREEVVDLVLSIERELLSDQQA